MMVSCRGAKVPQDGLSLAREQREACVLIACPLADVGARDVANVVRVEQQERPKIRCLQSCPRPGQTVLAQLCEIDPLLPIHRHGGATRRNLTHPRFLSAHGLLCRYSKHLMSPMVNGHAQ